MADQNEIKFLNVDGHYGGDQNWNRNWLMRLGGCSTVTACELSICYARDCPQGRNLYPLDPCDVTQADFTAFFEQMFSYVRPGIRGLTDIGKYADGLRRFAQSRGVHLMLHTLPGDRSTDEAASFIARSIDAGQPAAYLMLKHRNPSFDDFEWHWFTITGYDYAGGTRLVTAATYGKRFTLSLDEAWHTGYSWKGGLCAIGLPKSCSLSR